MNIIAYDKALNTLYGLDHNLSYMYSEDSGKTWVFISNEEWHRRKKNNNIVFSTKLKDILVGTTPSMTWTTTTGNFWGGKSNFTEVLS